MLTYTKPGLSLFALSKVRIREWESGCFGSTGRWHLWWEPMAEEGEHFMATGKPSDGKG